MAVSDELHLLGDDHDFVGRHIGPSPDDVAVMLSAIGAPSIGALIDETVPASIRMRGALDLDGPRSVGDVLGELRALADRNRRRTSLIGQGYYGTHTPPVIRRNMLENPAWYTAYTPYQPEIAQGRLEALLNFQTMVADLTGLPMANASLLDEATAAAEAMALCHRMNPKAGSVFFIDADVLPAQGSSALGVITGIWADSFDQQAFIAALVIAPLSLLGGVFYNVETLSEPWRSLTMLDPIYYLVDAARYGVTGLHESAVWLSIAVAAVVAVLVTMWAVRMFRTGRRLRP